MDGWMGGWMDFTDPQAEILNNNVFIPFSIFLVRLEETRCLWLADSAANLLIGAVFFIWFALILLRS